jgi:hypothetical protein
MRRANWCTLTSALVVSVAIAVVPVARAAAERGELTGDDRSPIKINLASVVKGAGAASADLIEQGDRTRLVVSLSRLPSELTNPSLIAEIHDGICGNLKSAPVYAVESTLASYLPAPYYFGGMLPVSLATLRGGAHAITVRAGADAGGAEIACGNIA